MHLISLYVIYGHKSVMRKYGIVFCTFPLSSIYIIFQDGQLSKDLFWTGAKDVWCIFLDPVYGDFLGAQSDINKPIPFLDAVPITIWLHTNLDPNSTIITKKCDKTENAGKYYFVRKLNSFELKLR